MKYRLCIFVYVVLFTSNVQVSGQEFDIKWITNYGGSQWDQALATLIMPDTSLITTGYTYSNDFDITVNKGNADLFVSKQNFLGEFEWIITFGGSNLDEGNCLVQSSDSTFLVAGTIQSNDGDVEMNYGARDIMLIKMNLNGEILWQKNYGGSDDEQVNSIIRDVDGGYVFCGETYSNDIDVAFHHGVENNPDYWVVKIDTMGEIVWENCYGNYNNDHAKKVIQLSDSTYMVVGTILDNGGDVSVHYGGADWWVLHISNEGELIWEKTFGGSGLDLCRSIINCGNGKYLLTGETYSDDFDIPYLNGPSDAWLLMIDSIGNVIWNKTFGGSDGEGYFESCKLGVHQIVNIGYSRSADIDASENFGDNDGWIVILDTNGVIMSEKSIGGSEFDEFVSISCIDSTSIFLSGLSRSDDFYFPINYGNFDAISLRLNICWNKYFLDYDGDGYGDVNADSIACDIPSGYVVDSSDCNDSLNFINPGVKEICNYLDDNCDGLIDEGLLYLHTYADADGDDYGNLSIDSISCSIPEGYVLDSTDCDDTNAAIYPGAIELLNGIDDDCDQIVDEGLPINELTNSSISLHPNPTFSDIHISSSFNEVGTFTIYSTTGQLVISGIWYSGEQVISLTTLDPGVYSLKLQASDSILTCFFIKL